MGYVSDGYSFADVNDGLRVEEVYGNFRRHRLADVNVLTKSISIYFRFLMPRAAHSPKAG